MSTTLGTYPLGTEPLAGSILHDPPEVTVLAPTGVISTGGPGVTVQWSYYQKQGDPQAFYQVRFTDDAGVVEHYTSGWLAGTGTSHVVNFDANEIPVDTDDLTCWVGVRTARQPFYVWDSEPIEIRWGAPHCTITYPGEGQVVTEATGLTTTWVFSDDDGANTQGWWRVILREAATDISLYDTGWTAGSNGFYTIPYTMSDDSSYEVVVQLKNNHGIRSD